MNDSIYLEAREGIWQITLNRPEVRNAVNLNMAQALAQTLERLDADDTARVGVLTGAGSTFCAGMDLAASRSGARPYVPGRGFAGIAESPPKKPLLAAVEGYALGGGLEIALACDFIIAGRGARLGIPEARRGLVARGGGLIRLPRRIGRATALELAWTGALVDAERALEIGLIDRLVDTGEAMSAAVAMADEIVASAPLAVAASKRIVDAVADLPITQAWEVQAPIADPVFTSKDAAEGAAAFLEKRPPSWTGE